MDKKQKQVPREKNLWWRQLHIAQRKRSTKDYFNTRHVSPKLSFLVGMTVGHVLSLVKNPNTLFIVKCVKVQYLVQSKVYAMSRWKQTCIRILRRPWKTNQLCSKCVQRIKMWRTWWFDYSTKRKKKLAEYATFHSKRYVSAYFFYCLVHGNRIQMDKSASTLSLNSNIVRGDTDFEESPRWLRKYQQEDEENALRRAIEESVKVTISVGKWKCHYINWSVL